MARCDSTIALLALYGVNGCMISDAEDSRVCLADSPAELHTRFSSLSSVINNNINSVIIIITKKFIIKDHDI